MSPEGSAEVRRLVESAPEIQPRLCPLSVSDFLRLDLPPRELLIDPILPKKGLAMLHAYRGIGKTHLALAIGYCAASGGTLFGTWSAALPHRVLYLDGEMPAGAMQERLAAIVAGFEAQPPDPSYFMLLSADQIEDGLSDLGTDEGRAEIDGAIIRAEAELIIVDNCSTLIRTGKENEGDSWLSVQSWALAHRRAGRSILFVHHDGKGGQQRGTSRREDVLDTVIALRRPEDYRAEQGARFEVVFEKARGFHGDKAQSFEAQYETRDGVAEWARTEISDVELRRVVETKDMTVRDAAKELGMSKSKVQRLRQQARDKDLLK